MLGVLAILSLSVFLVGFGAGVALGHEIGWRCYQAEIREEIRNR